MGGRGVGGGGWGRGRASIDHVCLLHGTFTMLLIKIALASYPGSRWVGKERAWYTLFAHAFNLPKIWELRSIF